ncbi:MAG: MBL fold metallo-hydrolase [Rhizobiaceae bacterium]|nr:MBL fold metallo-hydrolase [Rhizobiaceae bacterium]
MRCIVSFGCALVLTLNAHLASADQSIPDQYPGSMLYSKPIEVIPHVWSAIGQTSPSAYENAGHNNNLNFIVTGEGVVVVNGGGGYLLAKALHDEIRKITSQKVKLVINENGQGHAMLGNSYWGEQGVPILAHEDAAAEFDERGYDILDSAKNRLKDRANGTSVKLPDKTFSDKHVIEMGEFVIEVLMMGPAHSAGDTQVWLPKQKLVIAGDMAFHERMLPIFDGTDTAGWVETWNNEFEKLGAVYVIPGHGHPTNMDQVRRYTLDYLVDLRAKIGAHVEAGGELVDSYHVDQSRWSHLDTFEELATRNAGRVFEAMEFE